MQDGEAKKLDRFGALLGGKFHYEFSDADITRLQDLLNEMRDLIVASSDFTEGHRERLLKRLEGLQIEIHKRVSDLDKFWGIIGDAGVVAGKFGRDVKPLVDRMREFVEIVWRAQANAEQLPTSTHPALLSREEN